MTNAHPPTTDPRDQELAALRQRVADLEDAAAAHTLDLAIGQSLRVHIPDSGVFVFDADLRFVAVDAPALARIGVDGAAMVGHTIWELMPPETAALLEGPYRAALQGETSSFTDAFAGGVYRFVTVPVYNVAGQIIAGLARLVDITAQVAAEQQLHIFEQLVAHAPDGILVRSPDLHLTYANAALQTMLGYGPELNQMAIAAILAPESRATMAVIGQALETQELWHGRLMYQRADGTTFPGQATIFPVRDPSTQTLLVGGIIRDTSAQEAADQERQDHILAAQQAIVRELATPLIPLATEVIAMPLVGTIDSGRAQQIMETLLEGVVAHQAEYAILDITGVKMVDTQVAQALLRIAQAAKLLGAQILLSGVGTEIALTLTHLDADLTGIVPVANLQQAITYALAQRAAGAQA